MTDRQDDDGEGTWTSETLPLHLRRDLMKRELSRVLADRNVAATGSGPGASDESRPSPGKGEDKTRS